MCLTTCRLTASGLPQARRDVHQRKDGAGGHHERGEERGHLAGKRQAVVLMHLIAKCLALGPAYALIASHASN